MSDQQSFLHKLMNEPHYMVGAAAAGGLVIMTAITVMTAGESKSRAKDGDVDWSDSAGRTNSFQSATQSMGEANPAMQSYIAKLNDPRNQSNGAVDSTQLLVAGEDIPFDMNNAGLKGKKKAGLTGQGETTLAKMEELGKAKGVTKATVSNPLSKQVEADDGDTSDIIGAETKKVGKFDQVKRAFSGSSQGDNSFFAGFDMFRGFGNKDGKKESGTDREHKGYEKDKKNKERDRFGLARAFGDNAKENEQWHGNPFDKPKEAGAHGVEGAFNNAGQDKGQMTRGELGGINGGNTKDSLGQGGGGGGEGGGGGNEDGGAHDDTTVEDNTKVPPAETKEAAGPPRQEADPPPEEPEPEPKSYVDCVNMGRKDCGYIADWMEGGKHSCGLNAPCKNGEEPKTGSLKDLKGSGGPSNFLECKEMGGGNQCGSPLDWLKGGKHECGFDQACESKTEKESTGVGGHPNEVCAKSPNKCLIRKLTEDRFIRVESCPSGQQSQVLPYAGGISTCYKVSGYKIYEETKDKWDPWKPRSYCPGGKQAISASWPKVPKTGDLYCP